MKPMNGIHEVLHHSLREINNQCRSLRQDLAEFVNIASTSPATMMKVRLSLMSLQITMQASSLHNSHEWEGIVFVMMSDTDLNVHWAEKELSIKGKEYLKTRGYLILSPEEIVKMIDCLSGGIDSGQSAEAVEWLNRYESSLALEAKKLL